MSAALAGLGPTIGSLITAEMVIQLNKQVFLPMIYSGIVYGSSNQESAQKEVDYFDKTYAKPVFNYIDKF